MEIFLSNIIFLNFSAILVPPGSLVIINGIFFLFKTLDKSLI